MGNARFRAFVAVAHHGSLSAAARALGLSQPTVSSQINALERESRVELFLRRGYQMHLSSAGEALLPLTQRLLALEAEADFFLRNSGEIKQGHLKLGAVGPFHVIEMVAAYRRQFPGVEISIRMGNSKQVLADLQSYATDIAVLAGLHEGEGLDAVLYAQHPIVLFAHRDHPLAQRASVPLAALEQVELLRREAGSTTRTALETALAQAGVRPRSSVEVGSREALREAVARGLGVGAVSEAEFVPDERFRLIRIEGDPATTSTYVYVARERRASPLLKSFLGALALGNEALAGSPASERNLR